MDHIYERLYVMHYASLYEYAYRMIKDSHYAEDAVQDTFYKVIKYKVSFNNMSDEYIYNYLRKCTRHSAISIINNLCSYNNKCRNVAKETIYEAVDECFASVCAEDSTEYFVKQIENLNDRYRQIMYKYIIEGKRIKQIADELKMKNETVKKRVDRGRRQLKKLCRYLLD